MKKKAWVLAFKTRLTDRLNASTKAIVEDAAKVEYDYKNDDPTECADDEFDAICGR